tara:strand:- start:88 stop:276 length:189 start_codon:yes stop_codon:yes gene_type:complete
MINQNESVEWMHLYGQVSQLVAKLPGYGINLSSLSTLSVDELLAHLSFLRRELEDKNGGSSL